MTKVLDPNDWEKQIRANIVDPITAAHKAGQVVARMLAYEDFGHSLELFKIYGLVHTLQPPRWAYGDGLTYPKGQSPRRSSLMRWRGLRRNYGRSTVTIGTRTMST
jgi:hypothetical protein